MIHVYSSWSARGGATSYEKATKPAPGGTAGLRTSFRKNIYRRVEIYESLWLRGVFFDFDPSLPTLARRRILAAAAHSWIGVGI